MKVDVSEMIKTLWDRYEDMKGDKEATDDLVVDDLLLDLGYNKKRNKNIKRYHGDEIDWSIKTPSGNSIAVKVYALNTELPSAEREKTIQLCKGKKTDVVVITNGAYIEVLRFVENLDDYKIVDNIHVTKTIPDSGLEILSAISMDGFDLSIIDNIISSKDLSVEKMYEGIKSHEKDLKSMVCGWLNTRADSDEKFNVLWGEFYKDFIDKISFKEESGDNREEEIKQYKTQIASLEEQVKTLEEHIENKNIEIKNKDKEIEKLEREVDKSAENVHKRAVEMLDLVASSNDGTRHYVALIDDEIIQYDTLHKFVGRVLQQLYKIKSYAAQSFIFNGNIFMLSSKNVKYNDMLIKNVAYDVIINDDEEDDALLKLGTVFSHFKDITFVCKKLGLRNSNQDTGIDNDILDNTEDILDDDADTSDEITDTSGTKIKQETAAKKNIVKKDEQFIKDENRLSKSVNTTHENATSQENISETEESNSESNKPSNKLSSPTHTIGEKTKNTNETKEQSEEKEVNKEDKSNDNCTRIDSEDSTQVTKTPDKLLTNGETDYQNENQKDENSIDENEENTDDSKDSKNKDTTLEEELPTKKDEQIIKNSQTINEKAETNELKDKKHIEEGLKQLEKLAEQLDEVGEKDSNNREFTVNNEESDEDADFDPFDSSNFDDDDEDFDNTDEDFDFDSLEDEDDNEELEETPDEESNNTNEEESTDEEEGDDIDLSSVDFGDIGEDLSERQKDTEDKKHDKVEEIIQQKLDDTASSNPEDTIDEEDEPVLNQFEPDMDESEDEIIKTDTEETEAEELNDTEEIDTPEEPEEANEIDEEQTTEKKEAIVSEFGSGDDTEDFEAYFANQDGLNITIGRDADDEDEEDDEIEEASDEEENAEEETQSIPEDNSNTEVEEDTEEEYEGNPVLLVSQMPNVDKLMYTEDDVNFFNIKYIGSNDVTYLINSGEDETMTYERLFCKCVQAVVAIQTYNGDELILAKLKQKDLTGVNEHIKHKSAEFREYPALKVAPFVVVGLNSLKDVALAVLDFCKGMEIDMEQLFMYIEADTESEYIIENFGYDESSVQLRETEMYVHKDRTNESIAVLSGNMFNRVLLAESSLKVHKDVVLDVLAVKTKYLQRQISDTSEFASIVEETLNWAAHNNIDINLSKIGFVLGKNCRIVASDSSEVGSDNTQIEVRGKKIYVTNVENWQIPTALIKLHTALTNNTSIAIKTRINADAVNYYGSEYDTSDPLTSLAVTSYANYIASCVKQSKTN